MEQIFQDFSDRFEEANQTLNGILDAVPAEALDWVPMEGMNSAAVLYSHIAGSTRYWVGDVARQDSSNRVRSSEFEAERLTKEALRERLNQCHAYVIDSLGHFKLEELAEMRPSVNHDGEFSVGWSLLHALEHMTEHVGHLQILAQLWQMEA